MTQPLTHQDIRDFLTYFAAAIELDQTRVDALSHEKLHPYYDDEMWRRWRRYHLEYIDQVLPTVDKLPLRLLQELTQLAITYEPPVVRGAVVDLFCDAASGSCPEEECETATLFFGWLIEDVSERPLGKPNDRDPRAQMMEWLAFTDPLRISEDPECGYQLPTMLIVH